MSRIPALVALLALVSFAPPAWADYLYDSIRADCLQTDPASATYYSGADPVIGTVPIEKTETGRIGSNYLVYGGFRYYGAANYHGHLYAVRLFKEEVPYSNEWVFTDTGVDGLLSKESCEKDDSACLFDAGQMLKTRVESGSHPRRILTPDLSTATAVSGATGSYTLRLTKTLELDLTNGPGRLGTLWGQYTALAPIAAAMPQCEKRTSIPILENLAGVECGCPAGVPSTLCSRYNSQIDYIPPLKNPTEEQLTRMVRWLHADDRNTESDVYREWPLGDIYHASAAVVEPPGFQYLDRGYPEFREKLADRVPMIYVGANDGMIHAFYATHDFEGLAKTTPAPAWQPGEEAWAYLPANMLARTMVAVENQVDRFFSQDLSCRYTDVQVDTSFVTCTEADQARDEYCGWRTVLLCGQGWGGSWYVALDVTEPSAPKPLWEFTHLGSGTTNGLGRTWSLPSLSVVPWNKKPVWLALFGNGMNSSMLPYESNSSGFRHWYRNLNLPFPGKYSHQGQGTTTDKGNAYVLDVATGELLADLPDSEPAANPTVADGTVLDFDDDGFVDAGYLPGFKGMNRIDLGTTSPWMCNLAGFDTKGPLTGHPTAYSYKRAEAPYHVVLVAGAGIDSGQDPNEQANNGNKWGVLSQLLDERTDFTKPATGNACPAINKNYCILDAGFNDLNEGSRKARLLGAPIFTRRHRTGDNERPYDDLLLYTIWTAPHHNEANQQCDTAKGLGVAHLLCMDVTIGSDQKPRCQACDGFEIDKKEDPTAIYKDAAQIPSNPVSADGRIYVTHPDGGIVMEQVSQDGNDPNPNTNRPSTAVPMHLLSWREVYAE